MVQKNIRWIKCLVFFGVYENTTLLIGIDLFNLPFIDIYYKLVVVLSEMVGVKVYQATIGNFSL